MSPNVVLVKQAAISPSSLRAFRASAWSSRARPSPSRSATAPPRRPRRLLPLRPPARSRLVRGRCPRTACRRRSRRRGTARGCPPPRPAVNNNKKIHFFILHRCLEFLYWHIVLNLTCMHKLDGINYSRSAKILIKVQSLLIWRSLHATSTSRISVSFS